MKNKEVMEACLIEMFKRVGLDYSIEAIIEYALQQDWYLMKTWTQEEDKAFGRWMYKFLGENTRNSVRLRRDMVAFFMMQYGWKVTERA